MKKQLAIIGIVAILVTVGMSGCQESQTDNKLTSSDTNTVQLLDYTVETYGGIAYNWEKLGDGFIHDSSYNNSYYKIQGTIKNIAGDRLNRIEIMVNFYDKNNTFLAKKTVIIDDLANFNTEDFGVKYYSWESYFDNIVKVEFEFKAL